MSLCAFVVEDSPAIQNGLVEALSELAGIRTTGVATSEKEALDWLADPAHEWDLAIVDLLLQGRGSGLGVLLALRERDPRRKVVVLTATASSAVRERCLALGCDEVFDKAIQTDALITWCMALSAQAGEGSQADVQAC